VEHVKLQLEENEVYSYFNDVGPKSRLCLIWWPTSLLALLPGSMPISRCDHSTQLQLTTAIVDS